MEELFRHGEGEPSTYTSKSASATTFFSHYPRTYTYHVMTNYTDYGSALDGTVPPHPIPSHGTKNFV
jgi:hypothetical protein